MYDLFREIPNAISMIASLLVVLLKIFLLSVYVRILRAYGCSADKGILFFLTFTHCEILLEHLIGDSVLDRFQRMEGNNARKNIDTQII